MIPDYVKLGLGNEGWTSKGTEALCYQFPLSFITFSIKLQIVVSSEPIFSIIQMRRVEVMNITSASFNCCAICSLCLSEDKGLICPQSSQTDAL